MKKELLPWEKKYQCSVCGDFFKSWDDAQYHMSKVHARPDNKLELERTSLACFPARQL
jgi:hypothetical protein